MTHVHVSLPLCFLDTPLMSPVTFYMCTIYDLCIAHVTSGMCIVLTFHACHFLNVFLYVPFVMCYMHVTSSIDCHACPFDIRVTSDCLLFVTYAM